MKKYFIIFIVLPLLFAGCSLLETESRTKLAPQLAQEGMDYFNEGRYLSAIDSFQSLKDWYPFDKLAILAELKIADARYKLEEYDEAILAYEEFEHLHPRNEAIPYVVYRIGLCYFDQIATPDRDQVSAEKALATFKRLRTQFPDSPHAEEAEKKMKHCLTSMAAHELYVGKFYYKTKHYKAALDRLTQAVDKFPGMGITKEAETYISLCREKLAADKE